MGERCKGRSATDPARFVDCPIEARLHQEAGHVLPHQSEYRLGAGLERLAVKRLEVAWLKRSTHRKMDGEDLNVEQTAVFAYDVKAMQRPERRVSLAVRLERKKLCPVFLG